MDIKTVFFVGLIISAHSVHCSGRQFGHVLNATYGTSTNETSHQPSHLEQVVKRIQSGQEVSEYAAGNALRLDLLDASRALLAAEQERKDQRLSSLQNDPKEKAFNSMEFFIATKSISMCMQSHPALTLEDIFQKIKSPSASSQNNVTEKKS